jgi:hypothetical protein
VLRTAQKSKEAATDFTTIALSLSVKSVAVLEADANVPIFVRHPVRTADKRIFTIRILILVHMGNNI